MTTELLENKGEHLMKNNKKRKKGTLMTLFLLFFISVLFSFFLYIGVNAYRELMK